MHDPEVYPDPDVFLPERFIRDGKSDGGDRDPYQFAFGFGRRCVNSRMFFFAENNDELFSIEYVLAGTMQSPLCSYWWLLSSTFLT